jgi:cbb3-type cytochrome oxidase maturation protein
MSIIFLLLPLALGMALAFVVAFVWATRTGQFDDMDTPPIRAVLDQGGRHAPHDRGEG